MKFVFRLQGFLNLKEKLEEQRKLEYGKALAALELERQKKIALETERRERLFDFSEKVKGAVKPTEFARYNQYIEALRLRIIEQEKNIQKAEKVVEERRLILVEAMKERKTLETLREKDFEEYRVEEKRREQKVVDETVSYKYSSKAEEKGVEQ